MGKLKIKTAPSFDRQAKKLLSVEAQEDLFDYLEAHPEKGDIISGTGGVRKLRWTTGLNNKGKSGGVRILYHYSKGILIILITLYSKNEMEDIMDADKNKVEKTNP